MAMLKKIILLYQILPLVRSINTIFFPCDTDVNVTTVDCHDRPLRHVPVIKSTTVTSLDLSQTRILRVDQHAFSGVFPNLITLKLMGNCLPGHQTLLGESSCKMKIECDALKDLRELKYLYLSGNSLTYVPCLPESLIFLDLQNNCISHITDSLKTPNLITLLLNKNCYYANPCNQSFKISESVFTELSKLRNLTLGYNNLTAIPKGLPPSLETLDLKENTITKVPRGAFANLTHLKSLDLEWNCQRCDHAARPCFPCPDNQSLTLYPETFCPENSNITFLSLRGNSLKTFPEGFFRPLKNLKGLDLSDNLLAYAIQNGSFFAELKGLTWISLIYNYEPRRTFPRLNLSKDIVKISNLQILLLSGNFFRELTTEALKVLSQLKHLKKLELRMNFINSFDLKALEQLPSNIYIDLSQNMLNFLPVFPHLSCGVTVKGNGQNRNIYTQEFPEPPPMLIDRQVTSQGDLWKSNRPNSLDMFGDNVTKFPTLWDFKNYFCQHNLTVDLSQNDILALTPDVFVGIEKAVCLDLSFNYMNQALRSGVFDNMTTLVFLNLSYNRLDFYYTDALSEIKDTLEVLDVSNNEFHFNMKGMGHRFEFLQNLSSLKVLSLANNGIGMRIDRVLLSSSLKYLYFNGNDLDIMWAFENDKYTNFFQNLTNLIYLDISSNHLKTISPQVINSLPGSIQFLSLSHNLLNFFPWQHISVLRNLRHLDLSQNYLMLLDDVPHEVIQFGAMLSHLDLSYNHISVIPEDFFNAAQSLQSLYLSHNQIKVLNHQFLLHPFKNKVAIQKLTLHANPFKCDCDTSWFADFLRTTHIQIPYLTTYIHCEFPESQQGKSILVLDQRSCQDLYGSLACFVCSLLAVAFTVLPLLKHLYGWDLWYCLQVLWAGYKGYSQLNGRDSLNHYDAFVVFDTKNHAVRDWVYNELAANLENLGHRRFCLCFEERDWIPGLSCIENLHNAVYRSVKTVFVLSSGAAGETVNGVMRQAFFMVQQRLLDEKVDAAVLILLDEIFPKLKYLQLRKRLCRKSVLSWPRNPRAQPLFWNQLRMTLSSDNLKSYDNNMSESFM